MTLDLDALEALEKKAHMNASALVELWDSIPELIRLARIGQRLREALTVHLMHYSKDGYRICTEEFMREVVKESRAALAATKEES